MLRRTRILVAVVVVAVAVALAACHSTPSEKAAKALPGRTFVLQSSSGAGVVTGVTVYVQFTDSGFTASARCNHASGTYSIEQERLVAGVMELTAKGCDPERYAEDDWILKFFSSKPKVAIQDNTLTMWNDTSSLILLDRTVAPAQ